MSSIDGLVKVRIICDHSDIDNLADAVQELLEATDFTLIERTPALALRPPEEGKSRIFLTALPKNE
jgi:hypothetical protein